MIGTITNGRPSPEESQRTMGNTITDVLQSVIEQAVEAGVRRALNVNDATNRRLLSIAEASAYLGLSKREIYNVIGMDDLKSVNHGRRKLVDIRDLDEWISRKKG